MKTDLNNSLVATPCFSAMTKMIGAATLALSSLCATSAPLDCQTLAQDIHQKLVAKGVVNYNLTVVDMHTANEAAKTVGTCAGGAKKILYVKRSLPPIAVKPTSGEIGKSANVIPAQKPKAVEYGNKLEINERAAWARTEAVWGMRFKPEFNYDIALYELAANKQAALASRMTLTEIRYKN